MPTQYLTHPALNEKHTNLLIGRTATVDLAYYGVRDEIGNDYKSESEYKERCREYQT